MEKEINGKVIRGVISGKKANDSSYQKITLKRVVDKNNQEIVQFSQYTEKQVFHKNLNNEEAITYIYELMSTNFMNAEITTEDFTYFLKMTSKGHLLSSKKKTKESFVKVEQNKVKKYLLPEGGGCSSFS